MNRRLKTGFLTLLLLSGISLAGFAQTNLEDLQKTVESFSADLAKSLPFNASLGLNWSDAHIGKLFPGVPPHFGVGASAGFTTIDVAAMEDLAGLMAAEIPGNLNRMFLPAYAAEGRVGGLFFPFDVGFKFGYLPPVELFNLDLNYKLIGVDLRYAVLDGEVLPKISVGVGFNYLQGGVGVGVGSAQTFTYPGGNTLELGKPKLNFEWETKSIDFKVQASRSFFIITPYAGVGVSYAWSSAGYRIKADVKHNGTPVSKEAVNEINAYLDGAGLGGIKADPGEISSIIENTGFGIRAFGGISVNLMLFKIDLTGLYSFRDFNYGGSLGFRFQL